MIYSGGMKSGFSIIRTLEQVATNPIPKSEGTRPTPVVEEIEPLLDRLLDKKLAAKLAGLRNGWEN